MLLLVECFRMNRIEARASVASVVTRDRVTKVSDSQPSPTRTSCLGAREFQCRVISNHYMLVTV